MSIAHTKQSHVIIHKQNGVYELFSAEIAADIIQLWPSGEGDMDIMGLRPSILPEAEGRRQYDGRSPIISILPENTGPQLLYYVPTDHSALINF